MTQEQRDKAKDFVWLIPNITEEEKEAFLQEYWAMKSTQDEAQVKRDSESFDRSTMWANANWKQLLAKYPDRWIAVHECEVVADAETLDEVLQTVDELGISRSRVFTDLLRTTPLIEIPTIFLGEPYD